MNTNSPQPQKLTESQAKVALWTKGHYESADRSFHNANNPNERFENDLALIGVEFTGFPIVGHRRQMNMLFLVARRLLGDGKFLGKMQEILIRDWEKLGEWPIPLEDPSRSLWLRYRIYTEIANADVYHDGKSLLPDVTLEPVEHEYLGRLVPSQTSQYTKQPAQP